MSTLKVNTIQDASGGSSSTPAQIEQGRAKAWVNMNGTGTIAVRDSYNVSSMTDLGTGFYRLSFTTSMANTNYCIQLAEGSDGSADGTSHLREPPETGSFDFETGKRHGATSKDREWVFATVFGDV